MDKQHIPEAHPDLEPRIKPENHHNVLGILVYQVVQPLPREIDLAHDPHFSDPLEDAGEPLDYGALGDAVEPHKFPFRACVAYLVADAHKEESYSKER